MTGEKNNVVQISPSILAADFRRLGEQVAEAELAGVQRLHVDVMDGHFVPNLSMGPVVVEGLRPRTKLMIEVHLMVEEPARFAAGFLGKGADLVIVHHEVLADARPVLADIRKCGKKAGIAINPNTPVDVIVPYLPMLDLALCMTVFPGFGGQSFLPESTARIGRLRQLIEKHNPQCDLEVDGGIDVRTLHLAAGANVFVVGTGIFRHPLGITAAIRELQAALA
ncbi:MAG: ribulose-phosphate 3-epimerase [Planctomycetes bacterium]|nr:ribulose-phosphate 3-epimerase [Planctomycetota bacterium]